MTPTASGALTAMAVALLVILLAMLLQHLRYRLLRRNSAQDLQPSLHPAEAFHVIIFFRIWPGQRVVESARRFVDEATNSSGAKLIYAGQAACSQHSEQIGRLEWDGVVMLQCASRISFVQDWSARFGQLARELFADSYTHGMQRNRWASLMVPQMLLRMRLQDLLAGKWRADPLHEAPGIHAAPEFYLWYEHIRRLQAADKINDSGLVLFSLVKHGTIEQRTADAIYRSKFLHHMAAEGHGPLHLGRLVAVGGNARFDEIYILQFPSAGYVAKLLASEFFQGIARSRRLADNLMVATIPFTTALLSRKP